MKGAAQGFYASVIREGIRLPYKTANPEQEKRETEKVNAMHSHLQQGKSHIKYNDKRKFHVLKVGDKN